MTNAPNTHQEYISTAPEPLRPLLEALHAQLGQLLPDAEEAISYNMPGFKIGKAIIVGYAAFSKQCGIYVSPAAITANADEIAEAGFRATKTGITFSPKKPIPEVLVEKLVAHSRKDCGA